MSEFQNCGVCNRATDECVCGAKKGYFKCCICERDVYPTQAEYIDANHPCHTECYQAFKTAGVPEIDRVHNGTTEDENGDAVKVVNLPLQFVLQVALDDEEDPNARIKFAVADFLSNVIFAYHQAHFERQPDGTIKMTNFKLQEILNAAAEQERERKERLEKQNETRSTGDAS